MADETEQGTPASQEVAGRLKMIGAADCPVFYVNVGAALSTPFDIQLLLGDIVEADEGHVTGKSRLRIVMAPEHAALLVQAITSRLQQYAQVYGKLRNLPVRAGGSGSASLGESDGGPGEP